MKLKLTLGLLLCLVAGSAFATHIVGGELNYRKLTGNDYEISLTVYRDCYNGVPLFDNPASVGIFDANNNLQFSMLMPFLGTDTIENGINSACFTAPTNVCYEVTTYIDTITLPPIAGGYQLSYQRCCRNQTIQNIIDPLQTGATFYAFIPGPNVAAVNSNPVFNNWPPPFICQNVPWVFDHSAIDYDGDSLVYELCTPFNGASPTAPQPQPPLNPPYAQVQWQNPYDLNNVLGGIPLTINRNTGRLTAVPNTQGQFVAGICVSEYRNGVLLSTTRRDIQVNVLPCPNLIVAAIQSPQIVCGSNQVSFQNFSYGAQTYHWDFGIDTLDSDTSNAFQPVFNFPDTGTYEVTLVAFSGVPGCSDTTKNQITILPDFVPNFNFSITPCTREVIFQDFVTGASFDNIANWKWDFGDSTGTNSPSPTHIYDTSGFFAVQLMATSTRGCRDTVLKPLNIPQLVTLRTEKLYDASCADSCNAQAQAIATGDNLPFQYLWSDPTAQTTAHATNLCAGWFSVTVTDADGCTKTDSVRLSSAAPLETVMKSTAAYCGGSCIGTATTQVTGGLSPYNIIWNDTTGQTGASAYNLCPGVYVATILDSGGCLIKDSIPVFASSELPNIQASADDTIIYVGQLTNLHATSTVPGYTYTWTPPVNLSNPNHSDPSANPIETITYIVTIEDSSGCENRDTITIYVRDALCEEPEIFVPNAFSPNGDSNNDILFVRGNSIKELELVVYNRWGEKIFETNDPKQGWDGNYKGEIVNPGVYVYYMRAVCYGEATYIKKGNITVLR